MFGTRAYGGKTAIVNAEGANMPVVVTNDFPPNNGGIQRVMSLLAQVLALEEESVLVIAPQVPGSKAVDALAQFRILRYPGTGRILSFAAMTAYVFWARVTSRHPLTIASMWFPAGLAICFVPRFLRGRVAILAHGAEIAPSRGGIRRLFMRHVFSRADVIIANSNFTRDLLLRAGVRGRIYVVNPGIDAVPIAPARAVVPSILSVGRLVARKGFDTMITALPAILQKFPATRYEIVGAGPQRAELEALATRLQVKDHVVFLGSLRDDEMRAAYARAWLFALPVRAVGDDVEGFGLVYLEAALAELPAIGGRNSGAEDAIVGGETGLLVDGTSTEDVSAAVTSLLTDREGAERMGVRGRDRVVQQFTCERSTAELARLMSS
jgi:phosphatidyl-myo-inositol dimannoside synthase